MRRMRDSKWMVVVSCFIVGTIAVLAGYEWSTGSSSVDTAHAVKKDDKTETKVEETRASHEEVAPATTAEKITALKVQSKREIAQAKTPKNAPEPKATLVMKETKVEAENPNAACAWVEYPGDGPKQSKVTAMEWKWVMSNFHSIKADYLTWLDTHKTDFTPRQLGYFEGQMMKLKIERPPTPGEPDLAWRGIGALSRDSKGEPILRIGDGFMKFIGEHPQRGKFELARLIAQVWAPCDAVKVDGNQPWQKTLSCLGVDTNAGCGANAFSEAGWAISTALGYRIAHPGCQIPALRAPASQSPNQLAEGCVQ